MPPLQLLLLAAAVEAPITQVTVFTNEARVVRTAQLSVDGTREFEFPPLRDNVALDSIRVEATGAEVKRVDLTRLTPDAIRSADVKPLLDEVEKLDTELDRRAQERNALSQQRDAIARMSPVTPSNDPLKPVVKLNSAGWSAGAQFLLDATKNIATRIRDEDRAITKLNERRNQVLEQLRKLGNPATTSGWSVKAQLAGKGAATVTLTYLVSNARWTPTWDLQLQPDTNTVSLSLAGLVSQDTGEDWLSSALLLSTAIPSHATEAPKLATWKIGVADRFIPTPTPLFQPVLPPPPFQPLAHAPTQDELLRQRLMRLGVYSYVQPQTTPTPEKPFEFAADALDGEIMEAKALMPAQEEDASEGRRMKYPAAPAAAPAPQRVAQTEALVMTTGSASRGSSQPYVPTTSYSLSPPAAWRAPVYDPDSPVTLAGGYDLAFASLQKETVQSARGARRVALWSAQWPVTVERSLYPALTTDAYLVAEVKNPSQQVLPGGPAQLSVGNDPAGTARLKLVSPGESFTLPLGIDRALKPVRNVQMVEETRGLISKDEIGTYTVTIELANPYRTPIAVRVADQWPLSIQKEVETKLVSSQPSATRDDKKGSLEWRVTIAPQQKQTFTFSYQVKRPKNWKLHQQEVVR